MEEIDIGDKIMFHVAGNHDIGYTKGKRYVGTVLSRDSRSRLHVRAKGMPRACIEGRDVDKLIEGSMDFDMDEVIPDPVARKLYKLMSGYICAFGWFHESINGYIVYDRVMMVKNLEHDVMCLLHDHGFETRHIDSYSWWMTNERLMSGVTYTEGDIHIIVHECMEDYVDNVRFGEGFYKNK